MEKAAQFLLFARSKFSIDIFRLTYPSQHPLEIRALHFKDSQTLENFEFADHQVQQYLAFGDRVTPSIAFTGLNSQIKRLRINRATFSPEIIPDFMLSLPRLTHLTGIEITKAPSGNLFNAKETKEFITSIASLKSLRSIKTTALEFDSAAWCAFCDYISTSTAYQIVTIPTPPRSESEQTALFNSLAKNTYLSHFEINLGVDLKFENSETRAALKNLFQQNQTLTYFSVTQMFSFAAPPQDDSLNRFLDECLQSNHSLTVLGVGLVSMAIGPQLRKNHEARIRNGIQARSLVRYSRILLCQMPSQGRQKFRIPNELILSIFKVAAVGESKYWSGRKLQKVVKCLTDRRTLGMLHDQEMEFEYSSLYYLCCRALDKL